MKNKKVRVGILSAVLAAVIAVGGWLVLRAPGQKMPDEPPADSGGTHTAAEFQPFDISGFKPSTYRPVRQEREDPLQFPPFSPYPLADIFFCENQPCVFSYHQGVSEEDFSVDIVSMASGEILRAYGAEEFHQGSYFHALGLDQDGILWCAYYEWEFERVVLAPCRTGVTEDDVFSFQSDESPTTLAARDGYFVLFTYGGGTRLVDTSSGAAEVTAAWENVQSLCFDRDGNLYLLTMVPEGRQRHYAMIKYSPRQNAELWSISLDDQPYWVPDTLSCTPGGGIFLLYSYEGKLLWLDSETGTAQLLVDLDSDVAGLEDGWIGRAPSLISCAVDGQNRLYFNSLCYDFSDEENPICRREQYVLKPDRAEVHPADMVTLTITAPYKVDSIAGAIRTYQRDYPEVEVVWDTQYLSREELQKNAMEYKDQIALRVMTGDVGDLVMVTGSGLGTETMTETDAFADLSGYLDACPFRDELPDNFLDPLRGEDGAIRGLPLGVLPTYYVWNQDLLDELDIDPYTATWSQLLDLALEWKEQGADLSLEVQEAGIGMYGSAEQMLDDILLANLYDARQADGSIRLDQPYLRELLENFKVLYNSWQMIRRDGDASKALIVGTYDNGNVTDRMDRISIAAENHGIRVLAAPLPLGEVSQKRQCYAFCWAISQRSENQEAAWELLQYLAGSGAMPLESSYSYTKDTLPVNIAAQERWLIYRKEQWADQGKVPEENEGYFRQVQDAMNVPYVRFDQPTGWYDAVAVPLARYISGELTLDQAMEQANDNWERFLLE